MSNLIEVKVPDIGDYKTYPVIDIRQSRRHRRRRRHDHALESDKATLWTCRHRTPAWSREVKVAVGDKISEGSVVDA